MSQPSRLILLLLICSSFGAACARYSGGRNALPTQGALHVRQMQIYRTPEGHEALLLRLSRPGGGIRHALSKDGSEIRVEVLGAGEGEALPEREVEQVDSRIRAVRIARKYGVLRVTVELRARPPAGYEVQEMADWVLIRLPAANPQG